MFGRAVSCAFTRFPFRAGDGGFGLAVSDPADGAAIRAAEIVCGAPVRIAVHSFDDIATVLERQLDERTAEAADVAEPERRPGDDDIDSLRDLASGAPVIRAVNGLLERALEPRASAGMTTMLDDAVEKCRAGMTAASEVLRVTSVR